MTVGDDEDLVVAGAVGKPFGIHGEVYVFGDPDLGVEFTPGSRFLTGSAGLPLRVASSRVHRARLLVRFEGVEDREAAEALRGVVLRCPRAQAVLAEDAVWMADLLGRRIVDDDGAVIGVVGGARDGTAHDYLVVARPGGGELLIPAVTEFVDIDADPIVLHAIPGLVDEGE
ncbi:MAG: ribosome maturation factor RimM [Egibacteraceae bacterium]